MILYSYKPATTTLSEGIVPVVSGSALRMYVEASEDVKSAVSIVNKGSSPSDVTLELTRLDGTPTGLTAVHSLVPFGRLAMFLDELFANQRLPDPLSGLLRIRTTSEISAIGIRSRYNENRDFLITTTPPVNESDAATPAEVFFPVLTDGGGYTTQFILFDGGAGQSLGGTLGFANPVGESLSIDLK
jgi:hypothetical protein